MTPQRLLQRTQELLGDERGVRVYLAVVLANTLWNVGRLVRLAPSDRPAGQPSVAVLVPARNEERTIGACLESLLAQDWPHLKLIVLDDESTDGTKAVLRRFAGVSRLATVAGRPLPRGWLGKPWACAQLAEAARDADILVFVDADTRHAPSMVASVAAAMEREGLDMLSVVPGQELGGAWERWTVPVIPWALSTHLSPAAAQVLGFGAMAGAVGQVLAFRREAYWRVGGHGAVRSAVAEDMALARLATRSGLRWRLAAGWRVCSCRMYRGRREAISGLEKNLFPAMGGQTIPFLLAWSWLLRAFVAPSLRLIGLLLTGRPRQALKPAPAVGLGVVTWALVARAFGLPRRVAAEGPVVVAVSAVIALRSWWAWRTGRAAWKGRRLGSREAYSTRSARTTVR